MQNINYQIVKCILLQIRTPFSIGRLCTDFSSPPSCVSCHPATVSIPHGQATAFADRLTIFPPARAHKSPSRRLPTAFRLTTYWSSAALRLKIIDCFEMHYYKNQFPRTGRTKCEQGHRQAPSAQKSSKGHICPISAKPSGRNNRQVNPLHHRFQQDQLQIGRAHV